MPCLRVDERQAERPGRLAVLQYADLNGHRLVQTDGLAVVNLGAGDAPGQNRLPRAAHGPRRSVDERCRGHLPASGYRRRCGRCPSGRSRRTAAETGTQRPQPRASASRTAWVRAARLLTESRCVISQPCEFSAAKASVMGRARRPCDAAQLASLPPRDSACQCGRLAEALGGRRRRVRCRTPAWRCSRR